MSNATFERAKKELGETSVIDLVGIIGYYSLVSVTLNAFELPLPEGEKVPFDIRCAAANAVTITCGHPLRG